VNVYDDPDRAEYGYVGEHVRSVYAGYLCVTVGRGAHACVGAPAGVVYWLQVHVNLVPGSAAVFAVTREQNVKRVEAALVPMSTGESQALLLRLCVELGLDLSELVKVAVEAGREVQRAALRKELGL